MTLSDQRRTWTIWVCPKCNAIRKHGRDWCCWNKTEWGRTSLSLEALVVTPLASLVEAEERLDELAHAAEEFLTDADYTVSTSVEDELLAALGSARRALSALLPKEQA